MAIGVEYVEGFGSDTKVVRFTIRRVDIEEGKAPRPVPHPEGDFVEWEELNKAFRPGRWWRVVAPDGSVWCESSSEQENRNAMRRGDKLYRIWRAELTEWREVE